MSVLDQGVANVQNPAYCAALLAGFVSGYRENHVLRDGAPLPYLFIATPMLLQVEIVETIRSSQLGLRGMIRKLSSTEIAGTDLVLTIAEHARSYRPLTMEAIAFMLAARMIHVDFKKAWIIPVARSLEMGGELPSDYGCAIKLGKWFSELTAFEIANILKVTF